MEYMILGASLIVDAATAIGSTLIDAISHFFYTLVYGLAAAICGVIQLLETLYTTLCGTSYVTYDGSKDFLINVFFHNNTITTIYWAMAMIGIVLCVAFTIISVMRKSIDAGDKIRQPMGGILTGMFKSILLIISMNALMTVVVYASNVLLTQVDYVFKNGSSLSQRTSIEFTDEQYAAMARALDTIGNYSLNPSNESRYNVISCFNEIRDDLYFLQQTGVFDMQYSTADGASWQSVLQDIANSADLTKDLNPDLYNDGVAKSIKAAVKEMNTNLYFYPLESYTQQYQGTVDSQNLMLDRMIFLSCTASAAKNSYLNENMSLTDSLRGAYYYGEKSIYSYSDVDADFDITDINFFLMIFMSIFLMWDLVVIIMNCVARLFNMLLLYLISPLVLSTIPLDEGTKTKQWTTAFVVQCFGVLGTIISMRLLIILMPIIMSSKLVLFENSFGNMMAKIILIFGAIEVARRAGGMITGILADNAGMQAIQAGDMEDKMRQRRHETWGFGKWMFSSSNKQKQSSGSGSSGGGSGSSGAGGGSEDAEGAADLPSSEASDVPRDSDAKEGSSGSAGADSGGGSYPAGSDALRSQIQTRPRRSGVNLPDSAGSGAAGVGVSADAGAGAVGSGEAQPSGSEALQSQIQTHSRSNGMNLPAGAGSSQAGAASGAGANGAGSGQERPNRLPPPNRNA